MELPKRIQELVAPLYGKECCRHQVWKPRSLWLGFGEKIYHGNPNLVSAFYGEWEIGTYYNGWRVIKDGRLLCGSDDPVDCHSDLQAVLKDIRFGRLSGLKQMTPFDVRAEFDTQIVVDFLATISDGDECFSIINGLNHTAIEFSVAGGWKSGDSSKPWDKAVEHQSCGPSTITQK